MVALQVGKLALKPAAESVNVVSVDCKQDINEEKKDGTVQNTDALIIIGR